MFDLCLNALAIHGCLIVIGMISQVMLSASETLLFYHYTLNTEKFSNYRTMNELS